MRDVEAAESHALGSRQQVGQRARIEPKPLEVDPLVDQPQAVRRALLLVKPGASEP